MINNILTTGIQGVLDGMSGIDNAARRIARGGVDGAGASEGGGLVQPVMELRLYERSVEASARVVKSADEALGTLLDIRA